jgi:hypothetical protein
MITAERWLEIDATYGRGTRPVGAHFFVDEESGMGTFICDLCGYGKSVTGHWYKGDGSYGASKSCWTWCDNAKHFPRWELMRLQ